MQATHAWPSRADFVDHRYIKQLAKLAFNFKDYTVERFAEMVGWELTVIEGVLENECIALYRDARVALTR